MADTFVVVFGVNVKPDGVGGFEIADRLGQVTDDCEEGRVAVSLLGTDSDFQHQIIPAKNTIVLPDGIAQSLEDLEQVPAGLKSALIFLARRLWLEKSKAVAPRQPLATAPTATTAHDSGKKKDQLLGHERTPEQLIRTLQQKLTSRDATIQSLQGKIQRLESEAARRKMGQQREIGQPRK